MKNFVEPFREIINIGKNLNVLGEILNSSWKLKNHYQIMSQIQI